MSDVVPSYLELHETGEIARKPTTREIADARAAARRAGLHRLDERKTGRFLPLL